jgi:uncharacterized protein YpmB
MLKKILIVGVVVILIAAGFAGYVWFKMQDVLTGAQSIIENQTQEEPFVPSDDTPIANTIPESGITLQGITSEQKAAAEKVGIDLDAVAITPEMVGCAEQKLGTQRVQELISGESPTTLESISLLTCL